MSVLRRMGWKLVPNTLIDSRKAIIRVEEKTNELSAALNEVNNKLSHIDTRLDRLRHMVQGVEQYQPTYGVNGIIDAPARAESTERAWAIAASLGHIPGKRILDIGSSLGFFVFYFADRGALAEGWESNVENCEVSRMVQSINGIHADFRTKELNLETVKTILPGQFDVVFVLSVFHHIIRFNGLAYTQELVKELLDRSPVMVVELAKKGEDRTLPWNKSQPKDELAIFDLVKDSVSIKKIGDFSNHLSSKTRPLYIVQKKKVVKVSGRAYAYDELKQQAYKDSPLAYSRVLRRYYMGKQHIVKEYSLNKDSFDENFGQILNEASVLIRLSKEKIHHAVTLEDFDFSDAKHVRLVLKRHEGELLSEHGIAYPASKAVRFLKDIVATLGDLQKRGFYHNDIRSWNTIVHGNSAWLIDYGLLGNKDIDNNAVALLWLAHVMLTGEKESSLQAKTKLPPRSAFEQSSKLLALYDYVHKHDNIQFVDVAPLL